jgi:signal transduction histidine kinase
MFLLFVRSSNCFVNDHSPKHKNDRISQYLDEASAINNDSATKYRFTNLALNAILKNKETADFQSDLFKVANRFWNNNNIEDYLKVTRKILDVSTRHCDSIYTAKAYTYLSDYYFGTIYSDSSLFYLKKAQRIYQSKGDVEMEAHCIALKASYLMLQSDYQECGKLYLELLNKKNLSNLYLFEAFSGLGSVYTSLQEFTLAEKYYNRSLEIAIDKNDISWRAVAYNNLAVLFIKQQSYPLAERYLLKGLKLQSIKTIAPSTYSLLTNNLAIAKLRSWKLEKPDLIFESYRFNKSSQNTAGIIDSHLTFAEFFMQKKDTLNAYEHATNAYKIAKINKYPYEVLKALQMLWQLEPRMASQYAQEYSITKDSIYITEQRNRNKFARIEYETAELEEKIKKVELEKATLSHYGLAGLFVLLTGVAFWWQHMRKKEMEYIREKSLQNNQIFKLLGEIHIQVERAKNMEKKRIAQELHDGVMGRLTSIRLNLFALRRDTTSETIEKCLTHINSIQEIEKEIRSIAYDLGSDIFTKEVSFISIIKSLLDSIEEHTDLKMHLKCSDNIQWDAISNNIKMQIYRIIQESTHNIEKHANAENIFLTIKCNHRYIQFKIRDDGIGFCKRTVQKGFGLANIYGRARTIKAQLSVKSAINIGTLIKLHVPIEHKNPKSHEYNNTGPDD